MHQQTLGYPAKKQHPPRLTPSANSPVHRGSWEGALGGFAGGGWGR